jgi:hypothetical protein
MSELITLIANVSLALSFVAALIFGVAQVKAGARDRRERLTLETLRAFQLREFAELMSFVNSSQFPKNSAEARDLSTEDNVKMLQFSQQMESLGILVAERLIDIELVDKTLGNYVTTTWDKYKNFILPIRERDPYLNEYYQWLAEKMASRAEMHPRKPFYMTPTAR